MFGSIGMPELVPIFIVALLVFGPKKLPEIGKSIGKGLAEFKRASDDLKRTIEQEIEQGKTEVSAVKDHVAGIERSLRDTPTASAGATADQPAPASAEATADKPAQADKPSPGGLPLESVQPPDSRPIEPS